MTNNQLIWEWVNGGWKWRPIVLVLLALLTLWSWNLLHSSTLWHIFPGIFFGISSVIFAWNVAFGTDSHQSCYMYAHDGSPWCTGRRE